MYIVLYLTTFVFRAFIFCLRKLQECVNSITVFAEKLAINAIAKLCLDTLTKNNAQITKSYSVHTMLRHKDVSYYIICIYSLEKYANKTTLKIIHDDGSLTTTDIHLLQKIPFTRVIIKTESDREISKYYDKASAIKFYRKVAPRTQKIIDLLPFVSTKKILILDADVVFFRKPTYLIKFLCGQKPETKLVYLNDFQYAYATDIQKLENMYNSKIEKNVNCGLLCLDSSILSKNFVVSFFTTLHAHKSFNYYIPWIDQTPWAILVKKFPSHRLSNDYYMGYNKSPTEIISRHFVHGTRNYYLKDIHHKLLKPNI